MAYGRDLKRTEETGQERHGQEDFRGQVASRTWGETRRKWIRQYLCIRFHWDLGCDPSSPYSQP